MPIVIRSLLLACLVGAPVYAQHPECAPDGVAVGGYDLVSYHQRNGPIRGQASLEVERDGMRYRFASEANRQAFIEAPRKWLPRYDGFCATTLSMGRLACPDYTNFKIENGDLLLFELTGFTNGRTLWNSEPEAFRKRADHNARQLLDQ